MAEMTLIEIRVVIRVPEIDNEKTLSAIEKILETVRSQFPGLQVDQMHSPVIVTIKDMQHE